MDVGHQSQLFNGIPHYQPVLCTAQAHSIKMKRVKENCERKTPPTQTALHDFRKSQYSQSIFLIGDKSNKQSGGRIFCGKIKIFYQSAQLETFTFSNNFCRPSKCSQHHPTALFRCPPPLQTSDLSFFLHRDFLRTDFSPHRFGTKTAKTSIKFHKLFKFSIES